MRKGLIGLAILAAVAALLFHSRFGSTPAFRDASGGAVPSSVAEMHRLDLGGVPQSITIRGRSANAPILIWLHGGPGTDETGMWRRYNARLEDHFLVVYWTQRGTGRSYYPGIPARSMTLPQYVADLHQLVGFLQSRYHQQRVTLAGHSWGTNWALISGGDA
jgi:pimeloyl-ACP methyl ester carboxylesterase